MNLTYVFGPVVATDTLINVNVQFNRVRDKQAKENGWGWTITGDGGFGGGDREVDEEPVGLLEIDESAAIEELLSSLRDNLYDLVSEWREEHPKETEADKVRAAEIGITLP